MRIVSLLPSATEMICALGLREKLVGVTHECDFPPDVAGLSKVTQTHIPVDANSAEIDRLVRERLGSRRALYSLDRTALESLRPDLIVTQALCDVCAVAEEDVSDAACALPGRPRVLNLEPRTLAEVLACLRIVGEAAGCPAPSERVVAAYEARIEEVRRRVAKQGAERPRVVVLEWADPLFTCGHWSPEIVEIAGGREVVARAGEKSRRMSWEELSGAAPEVLILALCGFGVERSLQDAALLAKHPAWGALPAVRGGRVWVTDGSAYFSRPGPRLVDALEMAAHLLWPEAVALPASVVRPVQWNGVRRGNNET